MGCHSAFHSRHYPSHPYGEQVASASDLMTLLQVLDCNEKTLAQTSFNWLESPQPSTKTDVDAVADPCTGQVAMNLEPSAGVPEPNTAKSVLLSLSFVDRWLALWVILAMILGVVLGYFTDTPDKLSVVEVDSVSLPIALGLWVMMWPVLCKVRYELLGKILAHRDMWGQLGLSLFMNWIIGPALMTAIAWATLPDLPGYRNGIIMVGIARCIAMVLIWNQLARGNPEYCAIMVAINSIMQIVLFAPLSLFYLKVVSHQYEGGDGPQLHLNFWRVARSVLIYLGAPLVAGILTRYVVWWAMGRKWLDEKFLPRIGPLALLALLYTIIVLFALQGHRVITEIGQVCRVSVAMLVYFAIMWTVVMLVSYWTGMAYDAAVTQSFTAASNNFELAIAIAVGTFGVNSQEALAATVGPLIEVPALLALVYVALWLRKHLGWEAPGPARAIAERIELKRGCRAGGQGHCGSLPAPHTPHGNMSA